MNLKSLLRKIIFRSLKINLQLKLEEFTEGNSAEDIHLLLLYRLQHRENSYFYNLKSVTRNDRSFKISVIALLWLLRLKLKKS